MGGIASPVKATMTPDPIFFLPKAQFTESKGYRWDSQK
jgi:hypothetical protein